MKNFKIKNLVFCVIILLSAISMFFIGYPTQIETITTKASSYDKKETPSASENKTGSKQNTSDETGAIPFSLFVSAQNGPNDYFITDYIPNKDSWNTQRENSSSAVIYHYELKDEAIPYILLSSKYFEDDRDGSKKLFNSTVYFKFNDPDIKSITDNTIPTSAGYMSIEASVGKQTILVERDTSTNATTNDASILFAVNLQDLTENSTTVQCPDVNEFDKLGGNGDNNDVSFRTGLYNFKIRYSYKDNIANISNECVFRFAFYILDYQDYIPQDEASPFTFKNTNTYVSTASKTDSNYEIYNYNYLKSPNVQIDADKFGLNFTYTRPKDDISYLFEYKDFLQNYSISEIQSMADKQGIQTGKIVLELKKYNLTYNVYTYYDNGTYYKAKFDLDDFELFLIKNNINTTFQGTYAFDLDFLIKNNVSYSVVDKELFSNVPEKISEQKLVIFGYELKYPDQNPNNTQTYKKDVNLKNDVTHNNFISYNNASLIQNPTTKEPLTTETTEDSFGYLFNIPEYIAITDQAPLRFHGYGNLSGDNYSSKFINKSYLENDAENNILDDFNSAIYNYNTNSYYSVSEALSYLSADIDSEISSKGNTYYQGSPISGDGIRIIKLEYNLYLPIKIYDENGNPKFSNETISGTQYIVFEINNTVQNLYVQAYDDTNNSSFDFTYFTNKNVRINLEQKPNTFFAPVTVTYSYSSSFRADEFTQNGNLMLKTNSQNQPVEFDIIDNNNITKTYSYFVTDNNQSYTFKNSGYYKVSIKNAISNAPRSYSFVIDKTSFTGISVNEAQFNGTKYVKSINTLSTSLLDEAGNYLKHNLYITNGGFTLGWQEKASQAKSYANVYYMEITDDVGSEPSLFKISNSEYWLTNGLKFSSLSSDFDYVNSIEVNASSENASLEDNQYFYKDGLYYFYVYDDAGNYFTRLVLIDSSLTTALQGYWSGDEEASTWINTYDPVNNDANYVDETNTIYFGSHKAISLPNLSEDITISFDDKSFIRAYTSSTDAYGYTSFQIVNKKPPISFEFFNDVLEKLTDYVRTTNKKALIGTTQAGSFLTLPNTKLEYKRTPTQIDNETEEVIGQPTSGTLKDVYKIKIYAEEGLSPYDFEGEADYNFYITNCNTERSLRQISMNFDIIKGTFYAYGNDNNPDDNIDHYIKKNSGTNLNNLKFEYNKITDNTAKFYKLSSLTYTYYPFMLDYENALSDKKSYPFANVATKLNIDLLSSQIENDARTKYIIKDINIGLDGKTSAGKYVLTRTYVGGTHVRATDPDGNYLFNEDGTPKYDPTPDGTGGTHYYDEENKTFEDLFKNGDTITRKYIVYVDHNGIITTSYMVTNPEKREVGDNISISLSYSYDNEWLFKEFFLTSSSTLSLNTNKVPVRINIPLSKYFAYYKSMQESDILYSKLNFAQLEIKISYQKNQNTEIFEYIVDGYDVANGYCTCSKLISATNTKGYLIFKAQGTYTIEINDRTGYADVSLNNDNADNINPTTYKYSFQISHTSPSADMYTSTYYLDKKEFVTEKLTNEDNSLNFATNIKEKNSEDNSIKSNQVLITWNDSLTPYNAKVNQVNIKVYDENNNGSVIYKNIIIDLNNFNILSELANANKPSDNQNNGELQLVAQEENENKQVNWALLNLSDIANANNYINAFYVSYYKDITTPTIYDGKEYYRFTYTLYVNIEKEYIYDITLSYISQSSSNQAYLDENGKSFAESLYNLRIDRTKPFTNIDSLLANEDYLKEFYSSTGSYSNNINEFKEELFNVTSLEEVPSAFTYTFGVNNNFTLKYNSEDTSPYFYVRSYQKYDGENISITPDMVNTVYDVEKSYFTDYEKFAITYPRFSEINIINNQIKIGSNSWYKINYNTNQTLYSQISQATGKNPAGFYEIIEKDTAGNFRNYTVYFANHPNYLTLNISGYEFPNNIPHLITNNTSDNLTISNEFELTQLSSNFGWGSMIVKNETLENTFSQTVKLTPFDNPTTILNRIDSLNEFFSCEYNTRFSLTLSKYNSSFPASTRYINIITTAEAKLGPPTIQEVIDASTGKTTYTLKFPTYSSKSVIYLEKLVLTKLNNSSSPQVIIDKTREQGIPSEITGLTKGIYQALYKDNYNASEYPHILYVGEHYINDFDKEFNFEFGSYIEDPAPLNQNTYYTGGDITVTYEANIYKVTVNGVMISGNDRYESISPTLSEYNCKTFTISSNFLYDNIPAYKDVGGLTYYQIEYFDITNNSSQKTIHFYILDYLPEINLTNGFGGDVTSTLKESSSQINSSLINVNWGTIDESDNNGNLRNLYSKLFDNLDTSNNYANYNEVTIGILYTRNQNGEYKNGVQIKRGQKIVEEGYYKLQIKNNLLGNYREIYFVIQYGDLPLYTVEVDGKAINPSSTEQFNLTLNEGDSNLATKLDLASPTSIINIIGDTLTNDLNSSLNTEEKTFLLNQLGFTSDGFSSNNLGICNLTNIPHYYTIYNADIVYNSNIELNIIEFHFNNQVLNKAYKLGGGEISPVPDNVGTNYWTTIYLVYNLDMPIRIELFAVTKVPKITTLINGSINYKNEKSNSISSINLRTNETNYTLTNEEIKNNDITLYWVPTSTTQSNTKWYNQGNNIYISDRYGVSNNYQVLDFEKVTEQQTTYLTANISGSGNHNLQYCDLAGNIHKFASTSSQQDYFSILLIDSVIYHINYEEKDYNPINYGVFNDSLKFIIDKEYLSYYDGLTVYVTRNGVNYKGYTNTDNVYTFEASGRYVIQITALYAPNKTALNKAIYNFTIIDSNSARLAYEFTGIPGYEITKVLRNNEDITSNFKVNGKITELFISSTSSKSGNGFYTITLKYGKNPTDILTFSFTINDYVPTISCNVAHGETTKGSITISYNPNMIYEQLGVCYIKVLTYNNDSKSFYTYAVFTIDENNANSNSRSFDITQSNSYFIQVETKSGNTISSFRVNKTDPLNVVAIIIIVVSIIAVVVLIIVVLKLRNRMKIK